MNALNKYTFDITKKAHEVKIDPIIVRDEEIRRTFPILARRTKNNPQLIGEPGKTAIVDGLAQRIIITDVPESLHGVSVKVLDFGILIVGAKFRGEFEEKLEAVQSEVAKLGSKMVLYIDEMHTIFGSGAQEGLLDASNLLKPALTYQG